MEALKRREGLSTASEMRVARAAPFAVQVVVRRLIADRREQEVREIRNFISPIVPDPNA